MKRRSCRRCAPVKSCFEREARLLRHRRELCGGAESKSTESRARSHALRAAHDEREPGETLDHQLRQPDLCAAFAHFLPPMMLMPPDETRRLLPQRFAAHRTGFFRAQLIR